MKLFLNIIKWFVILLITFIILWFFFSFIKYRLISSDNIVEFQGDVEYKFIEINFSNRAIFEDLVGNRAARTIGNPTLYISKADREKLWPENPRDMAEKNYTINAKLTAKPLLFGGFSKATVQSVEIVNRKPKITK